MQIAPTTTPTTVSAAAAPEDASHRADEFARVLQTAFSGLANRTVVRASEAAPVEAASRVETRPAETRPAESRSSDSRPGDSRAPEAKPRGNSEIAQRDAVERKEVRETAVPKPDKTDRTDAGTAPAERVSGKGTPATGTDATAAADPAVGDETEAAPTGDEAEAATTAAEAAAPAGAHDVADAAASVPAVDAGADAALILALLQTVTLPAGDTDTATAAAATAVAPAPASAASPVAAIATAESGAVAALAAAAPLAVASIAVPAEPAATLSSPAAIAAAATETQTSMPALLVQQQAVTPEEMAAIQRALAAQQAGLTTAEAGIPADAKPATPAAVVTVESQAQTPVAVKAVVDQSSLLAMQGDADHGSDTASTHQQAAPVQAPVPQPAASESKFAVAMQADLQQQANAAPQTAPAAAAAAQQQAPGQANTQSVAPMSNPGTPVQQAAQTVSTQAAARNLGNYMPLGEQVAVHIKRGAAEGLDKISIRLDPGSLGKVDIKMEVGHDGRLTAVIAADKPETMLLLQREAGNLEQSLRDVGMKTSSDSLSFTLRDQGQAADRRDGHDGNGNGRRQGRGAEEYAETGNRTDPAAVAAANAQRVAAARGGLDIRI